MGCCQSTGFPKITPPNSQRGTTTSVPRTDEAGPSHTSGTARGNEDEMRACLKRTVEILKMRAENGKICRQFPVKETHKIVRSVDGNGMKMINEYIRMNKNIASGNFGRVALYRSSEDGKQYAFKVFRRSLLLNVPVGPSETCMDDVQREILIMKMLDHPNIVNLIEVIDDPESDKFYMVLEYVEGKLVVEEGSGGLGEETARRYFRDIVSGLSYLHSHNIIHGDIQPDNLLITRDGKVKIAHFCVSQAFENNNDQIRRSPGAAAFTAPECTEGLPYYGKPADTWAAGVTLYYMLSGEYPFLGVSIEETYHKIANDPVEVPFPYDMNDKLKNLIQVLLFKLPRIRLTLDDVAKDKWFIGDDDPIPEYLCWCKRKSLEGPSTS